MTGRPVPPRLVLVGRAAGAFGVRGELRLAAYTQAPLALLAFGRLLREDGAPALTLVSGRASRPGEIVVRAKEVADKEAADALRGLSLYVPREALPAPDDDEFYLADLIGLAAVSPAGEPLGRVKAVLNHGASDILELEHAGRTRLVAFTAQNVPSVEVGAGRLTVLLPQETGEAEPDEGSSEPAS